MRSTWLRTWSSSGWSTSASAVRSPRSRPHTAVASPWFVASPPTVTIVRRAARLHVGQDPLQLAHLVAPVWSAVGAVVLQPHLRAGPGGQRPQPAHRGRRLSQAHMRNRFAKGGKALVEEGGHPPAARAIASSASAFVAYVLARTRRSSSNSYTKWIWKSEIPPPPLRRKLPEASDRVALHAHGVQARLRDVLLTLELIEEGEQLLAGQHAPTGRMRDPLHVRLRERDPRLEAALGDGLPEPAYQPHLAFSWWHQWSPAPTTRFPSRRDGF